MKKVLIAGLVNCLFAGTAVAENLDKDTALGMASLMICTTFYAEQDMQIEGSIVGQSMMMHKDAGIEEMIMSKETSEALDAYMDQFKAANKEQQIKICDQAIKFARESDFITAE
ncbi:MULTISPECIES: hypothetical protein [unclassified Shewanella]|uniref:hypothetical protein n=1 Tax=unclassified Shewanella TaxID=196818 RepID=UPI001BC3E757|nr:MULTISPECIES: hypothetical protein [unclassified Shewanella]GIU15871.1 hypothetical protein TUM4444_27800 [Shewanella sp. MBTL60-112-B1]GIU39498.1 hypothetical protein TUM4445_36090 [Shewanella sp. MBTL60-112-B2]